MLWNPAGAEECSSHFITTIIPPATTTTLTITSGVSEATTITGPLVAATTVTPEESIPTYIVRACYGDVAYRFESACSCIAAGPTSTTAAVPVVTDTVIVPFDDTVTLRPLSSLLPPVPMPIPTSGQPACVPVGLKPVVVTVQVDEVFQMSLTVSGPTLCIGETAPPAPVCNCTSALPSASFSSFTNFANRTSTAFSTVLRTSTFSGFFNRSSTVTTSEEATSTPAPTSLETSETSAEPSSTESSQEVPSTTTSSSDASGPTHFIPVGRQVILQIIGGTYDGQYIESDKPDDTTTTNMRSHVTPERADASTWTLEDVTGFMYQEIDGLWYGAYYSISRTLWSRILLMDADVTSAWQLGLYPTKLPLECHIDFTASNVITCGYQQWTRLMQSDKCGWAISTPFNPSYAAQCPDSEETFLQAITVDGKPDPVDISK